MAVYKYRRIEDMPEAWEHFGNHNPAGRLRAVLSWSKLAGPLGMPRGVAKFHSVEDLAADRGRYEQQRIDRRRK
jgi:hypothetical protein